MTAAEYLQSEGAAADLAALLAQPDPKFKGTTDGDGVFYLERGEAGAWRTVELDQVRGGANVTVYYRADGDYRCGSLTCGPFCDSLGHNPTFLVTDLGEGVRALRLRSGSLLNLQVLLNRIAWPEGLAAQIEHSNLRASLCADGVLRSYPTADDLPAAIARTMLAASLVAALEVP